MKPRFNMSAVGSYVSAAGALSGADEGVKHVIKLGFITRRPLHSTNQNDLEIVFSTDHVLLDFNSLIASDFDVQKIIKDCDFVKRIAQKHPNELKMLLEAYTSSPKGFEKAAAIAEEIGLTEKASLAAGGGVAWLVVLLIIAIASKACEDARNGNPQGKPNPDLKR